MKKAYASLLFLVLLLGLFSWMAVEAKSFQTTASYFPFYIALLAGLLTCFSIVKQVISIRKGEEVELFHEKLHLVGKYTLWIIGYIVFIYLVGMVLGTVLYLLFFLYFEAKLSLYRTVFSTSITVTVIILLSKFMELKWPSSLIQVF